MLNKLIYPLFFLLTIIYVKGDEVKGDFEIINIEDTPAILLEFSNFLPCCLEAVTNLTVSDFDSFSYSLSFFDSKSEANSALNDPEFAQTYASYSRSYSSEDSTESLIVTLNQDFCYSFGDKLVVFSFLDLADVLPVTLIYDLQCSSVTFTYGGVLVVGYVIALVIIFNIAWCLWAVVKKIICAAPSLPRDHQREVAWVWFQNLNNVFKPAPFKIKVNPVMEEILFPSDLFGRVSNALTSVADLFPILLLEVSFFIALRNIEVDNNGPIIVATLANVVLGLQTLAIVYERVLRTRIYNTFLLIDIMIDFPNTPIYQQFGFLSAIFLCGIQAGAIIIIDYRAITSDAAAFDDFLSRTELLSILGSILLLQIAAFNFEKTLISFSKLLENPRIARRVNAGWDLRVVHEWQAIDYLRNRIDKMSSVLDTLGPELKDLGLKKSQVYPKFEWFLYRADFEDYLEVEVPASDPGHSTTFYMRRIFSKLTGIRGDFRAGLPDPKGKGPRDLFQAAWMLYSKQDRPSIFIKGLKKEDWVEVFNEKFKERDFEARRATQVLDRFADLAAKGELGHHSDYDTNMAIELANGATNGMVVKDKSTGKKYKKVRKSTGSAAGYNKHAGRRSSTRSNTSGRSGGSSRKKSGGSSRRSSSRSQDPLVDKPYRRNSHRK